MRGSQGLAAAAGGTYRVGGGNQGRQLLVVLSVHVEVATQPEADGVAAGKARSGIM